MQLVTYAKEINQPRVALPLHVLVVRSGLGISRNNGAYGFTGCFD